MKINAHIKLGEVTQFRSGLLASVCSLAPCLISCPNFHCISQMLFESLFAKEAWLWLLSTPATRFCLA